MRQRGFSLVEVLVGILILTIVVTTSLAVFIERNRRLQQASETILAYQALSNESEYWRRKPYGELEPLTFNSDLTLLKPLEPCAKIITVTPVRPGIRNVNMTIRWKKHEARLTIVRVDTGGTTPLW